MKRTKISYRNSRNTKVGGTTFTAIKIESATLCVLIDHDELVLVEVLGNSYIEKAHGDIEVIDSLVELSDALGFARVKSRSLDLALNKLAKHLGIK